MSYPKIGNPKKQRNLMAYQTDNTTSQQGEVIQAKFYPSPLTILTL